MSHVWILQGFDRRTELEVEAIDLRGVPEARIRKVLGLGDDEQVGGGFDVSEAAARELEQIIGRPLRADLDYQLGVFED